MERQRCALALFLVALSLFAVFKQALRTIALFMLIFFLYTFCSRGWEGPLSAPRFYFMYNIFRMPDAKIKGLLEIALSLKKALSNIYYNNLSNELHTLVSSMIQMFMYKILIICEFDYKNF